MAHEALRGLSQKLDNRYQIASFSSEFLLVLNGEWISHAHLSTKKEHFHKQNLGVVKSIG